MNNLVGVLMWFRERECGVTGDIRKMYHTVKICLRDQHVHRFLWWNMKSDQRPDIFVMTAVSFGDRPATAIATMVLQKTAAQRKDEYPEAAQTILENSYVDDIVDSFTSKEHAGIITKNIDRILEDGSFVIKHWRISGDGSTTTEQIVDKDVASERVPKVLGVAWNSFSDKLPLTVKLDFSLKKSKIYQNPSCITADVSFTVPDNLTKRMILSQVNGIYDQLGLVGPFTVHAKIMLRKLFVHNPQKLGWDDNISPENIKEWRCFFKEMMELENIEFPRCVKGQLGNQYWWFLVMHLKTHMGHVRMLDGGWKIVALQVNLLLLKIIFHQKRKLQLCGLN